MAVETLASPGRKQASGYALLILSRIVHRARLSVAIETLARADCERFPFADTPGLSYNRGPGGGFYAFKA